MLILYFINDSVWTQDMWMWEGRSRWPRPSGEYISPLSSGSSQEVLAMITLLTLENTRTILCCWKAVVCKKQQKRKCFFSILFLKGYLLFLGISLGFYWPELRYKVIKLFPQRLFQHHFLCGNWGQNCSILKWKYEKTIETLSALGKLCLFHLETSDTDVFVFTLI